MPCRYWSKEVSEFLGPSALPPICIVNMFAGPVCANVFCWNYIAKILKKCGGKRSGTVPRESVYGLNQGLVDWTVEADRWIIDRSSNGIVEHTSPERKYWLIPGSKGVCRAELPAGKAARAPLSDQEVHFVFKTARKAEVFFQMPQDVEWTYEGNSLVLLQSRPITTLRTERPEDERVWYLSLHRSYDNLKKLRRKIEGELIPKMISIAKSMARVIHNHSDLTDFKHGDVLVCDAVDPNITFVVPIVSGVVERRGEC